MRPSTLRSSQVAYANAPMSRLITTTALIRLIHQTSCTGPHLHVRRQPVRVRLRDPDDTRNELARDARAQALRGAVRGDRDVVAGRDAEPLGVLVRQLDLRPRPLELELGHALDGRAREERPVAQQAQALA